MRTINSGQKDVSSKRLSWSMLLLPLVLAMVLLLVRHEQQPPAPAKMAPVSATHLQSWVKQIAAEPHRAGSAENKRVRDLILAEFTRLGMKPETQSGFSLRQSKRFGGAVASADIENIIAILPGKDRLAPAVAIMAHYDSVPFAAGAGDDAVGTASLLETARLLAAGKQPKRDIVFLVTDAEEIGLLGAQKFFNEHPLARHVGAVVNAEARGSAGRALMFQTSPNNASLIDLWASHAVYASGNSLTDSIYQMLPNDTDLTVPLGARKIGINGAITDGYADYHAPSDIPANLDPGSLSHIASFAYTTTQALAMAPQLPVAQGSVTFFDVFGAGIVRYPVELGWLLLALAAAGLIWLTRRLRRAGLKWRPLIGSALGAPVIWALAAALAHFVANGMFPAGTIGDVSRSIAMPQTLWAIGLIVSGFATLFLPRVKDVLAVLLVLLVAGLAAQIWMPGGSWLLAVPLLAAIVVTGVAQLAGWESSAARATSFILGGLVLALICQTIDNGWISVGTMTAGVVALAIPFAFALLGPLILPWSQGGRRLLPAAILLIAGLGLAVVTARADPFDARHPRPHDLFHLTDASGKNWWVSTSGAGLLPGGKGEDFPLEPRGRVGWTATPAPAIAAAQPQVTTSIGGGTVQIGVKSDQPVRVLRLAIKPSHDLAGARLNGLPVVIKGGEWLTIRFGGATLPDLKLTFPADKGGALEISALSATDAPPGAIPLPKGQVASNWALLSGSLTVLKHAHYKW